MPENLLALGCPNCDILLIHPQMECPACGFKHLSEEPEESEQEPYPEQ